jgi:hypothetical protein
MEKIREIGRKELLALYMRGELVRKNRPISPTYETIDWEDSLAVDRWAQTYGYKAVVFVAFRRYAYVRFNTDDLLDMAVADEFFGAAGPRLRDQAGSGRLISFVDDWIGRGISEQRPWYPEISQGRFPEECATILRPACHKQRRHGAKLYVVDGAGRTMLYTYAVVTRQLEANFTGYIGLDPDPACSWMQTSERQEYIRNAGRYASFEAFADSYKGTLRDRLRQKLFALTGI